MSTHLRHCPKHRKPLPCSHCAMIAAAPKPAEPATEPVKRGRGRPAKYASEEDRQAADAARKRGERVVKKAEEIIAENPDSKGANGDLTGGNVVSVKLEKIGATQILGGAPESDALDPLDRKRTAPKTSVNSLAEKAHDEEETESTHVTLAFRRGARELKNWTKWDKPTKRICPDADMHDRWARMHENSKTKVYCGKCGKLLVNPGKLAKGIFTDAAPRAFDAA